MSDIKDYTISDSILPDSIKYVDHFRMFDLLAKKRFDQIEIDAVLVYLIDRVDASAIPFLAKQFDVLGYKGMRLTATEQQQREVLKRAIELHRYKGTVWAVKEALKNIGYPNAQLVEHADPEAMNSWATFRIVLEPGSNSVSSGQIDELVKMVNEYKNVRSHLVDISYKIESDEDSIAATDNSYEGIGDNDEDGVSVGGNFFYDGANFYDGSKNYSNDTDVLEIQIINV